jgi:hypothetical protein
MSRFPLAFCAQLITGGVDPRALGVLFAEPLHRLIKASPEHLRVVRLLVQKPSSPADGRTHAHEEHPRPRSHGHTDVQEESTLAYGHMISSMAYDSRFNRPNRPDGQTRNARCDDGRMQQ